MDFRSEKCPVTGRRDARDAGFSLVELMVVVAVIGILAAIAIPNFQRFQMRAKSSEAKTNIAAIRTAQEAYAAESNGYVSALPQPASVPGPRAVAFGAANAGFEEIGWLPEGKVFFNYAITTTADAAGFNVGAQADIDGTTPVQIWGYRKPSGTTYAANSNGCPTSYSALPDGVVGPCSDGSGLSVF